MQAVDLLIDLARAVRPGSVYKTKRGRIGGSQSAAQSSLILLNLIVGVSNGKVILTYLA